MKKNRKLLSIILAMVMTMSFSTTAFAKTTTLSDSANSKYVLGSDDNLFVTVTTTYTYTESYTPVTVNNIFAKRTQSFTAKTTDKSANIRAIFSPNVIHWSASGKKMATFELENQPVVFPSDAWYCAYRIDTTQRSIVQNSTEYGTSSYSFTGPFITGAVTETAEISFNV